MATTLDLGSVVGHILFDLDRTGLQQAKREVKDVFTSWDADARRSGETAGKAAGEGLERGTKTGAKGATEAVRRAGSDMASAGKTAGTQAGRAVGDGLEKGAKAGSQDAVQAVRRAGSDMAREAGQAGAKAGRETREKFDSETKKVGDGLGSSLKSLGAGLVAGLATGAVAQFYQGTIKKASDLNEALGQNKVVFGESSQAMVDWASHASDSFGLSQSAAIQAANQIGDMFTQLGVSATEAAGLSQEVVQLAGDLGSFKNLDTADALERITAGFRGEYDSLQLLIPNINAARVEEEALAMTHKRSKDDLTAQEKALATLNIVKKDGAKASGDFARTLDGEANASKAAAAKYEEMQATIGQKLLPVKLQLLQAGLQLAPALTSVAMAGADVLRFIAPLASDAADVVTAFTGLPGPIKGTAVALGLLVAFRGPLNDLWGNTASGASRASETVRKFFSDVREAQTTVGPGMGTVQTMGPLTAGLKTATTAVGGLKGAASGLMAFMGGPWGVGLAAAGVALSLWSMHQQNAKAREEQARQEVEQHEQAVKALQGTLEKGTGKWTEDTAEMLANQLQTDKNVTALEDYGFKLDSVYGTMADTSARDTLLSSIDKEIEKTKERLRLLDDENKVNSSNSQAGAAAARNRTEANKGETDALQAQLQVLEKGKKAVQGHADAVTEASKKEREHKAATDSVTKGIKGEGDAAGAAAKNTEVFGKELDKNKSKAEQAAQALDLYKKRLDGLSGAYVSSVQAEMGYQQALDGVNKSLKDNGRTLDLHTEKGRANMQAMIGLATAARESMEAKAREGAGAAELNTLYDTQRAKLEQIAISMGKSPAAAKAMAASLMGTRDAVSATNAEMADFNANSDLTASVEITGASTAIGLVNGVSYSLKTLPNGKQVWVRTDTNAEVTSQRVIRALNAAKDRNVRVMAVGTGTAVVEINGVSYTLKKLPSGKSVWVKTGTDAQITQRAVINMLNSARDKHVRIQTDLIRNHIDNYVSRHGRAVNDDFGPREGGGLVTREGGGVTAMAGGGFLGGTDSRGSYVPREPGIFGGLTGVSEVYWPSLDGRSTVRMGEAHIPWEVYISGKPSARSDSVRYLGQAARLLGMQVTPMAAGGFLGSAGSLPAGTPGARQTGATFITRGEMAAMLDAHANRVTAAIARHGGTHIGPHDSRKIMAMAEHEKRMGR